MSYRRSILCGAGLSFVSLMAVGCGDATESDDNQQTLSQALNARVGVAAHDQSRGGRRHHDHHHRPGGGDGDGGGAGSAMVRIAAMGFFADLDVCLSPAPTGAGGPGPSSGPLLRAHGLPAGLASGQVSSYFAVAPGTYDLRVLPASALDCSASLAIPSQATLSAIASGEYRTLVVSGEVQRTVFRVLNLLDARDDATKVRLVSTTLPSPTLGIGLGTGASFAPWITGVLPNAAIGSPPQTDVDGYVEVAPVSGGTVTVLIGGTGLEYLQVPNFQLGEGEAVTFFARGFPGGAGGAFHIVTCPDGVDFAGPLTPCSVTSD